MQSQGSGVRVVSAQAHAQTGELHLPLLQHPVKCFSTPNSRNDECIHGTRLCQSTMYLHHGRQKFPEESESGS